MIPAVSTHFSDRDLEMPVFVKKRREFWALQRPNSSPSSAGAQQLPPDTITIAHMKSIVLENSKISRTNVAEFSGCHLDPVNPNNAFIRGKRGGVVGGMFSNPDKGGKTAVVGSKKVTEQFFQKVNSFYLPKPALSGMRSAIKG